MSNYIDTIVVGGGQAGLSTSWHLTQIGREHKVLDRGEIGDTWRKRWDSFCLVTPNCNCQLPGFPYSGDDPDGFMLRDEIVTYVEDFARSFEPPIQGGIEVHQVSRADTSTGFRLHTSEGVYEAANVIICTGTHQHPSYPAWSKNLADDLLQIHTCDYRRPSQLPHGGVLVVGSGQSGCQVVQDLLDSGRDIHLCVGHAGRIPRRYRGRDIIHWLVDAGCYGVPVDEHPEGRDIRFKPHEHLSGRDGGKTIDLRHLALDGVRLYGRVLSVEDQRVHLADDLAQSLDAIDEECRETLQFIDDYIEQSGTVAPDADPENFDWSPLSVPTELDLRQAGIQTVIYGTGFRFDFRWINLPIFNDRGYPDHERGITRIPGLYFVGLHWQHTAGSGLFYQVGRDAEYIVDQIGRNRTSTGDLSP